jgi:hypothetical protein
MQVFTRFTAVGIGFAATATREVSSAFLRGYRFYGGRISLWVGN